MKKDSGLKPDELKEWDDVLQSNPQLAEEIDQFEKIQKLTKQLPADFVDTILSEPYTEKRVLFPLPRAAFITALASAAMLMVMAAIFWTQVNKQDSRQFAVNSTFEAGAEPMTRLLPDGTLVRMNSFAHLKIEFSAVERHVSLIGGEAHFSVTKDPQRPFVVSVDGVCIQAVGTAFNVKKSEYIEVIVTEGVVWVSDNTDNSRSSPNDSTRQKSNLPTEEVIKEGNRAEILLSTSQDTERIQVFETDSKEVDQRLQWRRYLLTLEGETLVEIADSFERKTGYRLIIADKSLYDFKIGGRFPSDDVMGFLRVLQDAYSIPSKQIEDGVFIIGLQENN